RLRLGQEGLQIVLPIGVAAFDEIARQVGSPALADLMTDAAGAIVVGDGGSTFFDRFEVSRAHLMPGPTTSGDPLDDYTRGVLTGAVSEAWGGPPGNFQFRLIYPFIQAQPALPFQRLGCAAGLPPPGPLGIQIHPTFGPWWAYRALIVVSFSVDAEPDLASSCPACSRPCVSTCPAQAVTAAGFIPEHCITQRMAALACRDSCASRRSCPVGAAHRYSDDQLAFHMRASFDLVAPGK
ncbi:MAG: hypothetical protein H7X95_01965, partial [Deltaproteobacteria bacterium]|nr:hypothetical protein [Deltaproteobacteria bacterium]